MSDPHPLLSTIRDRLAQGTAPTTVIEELAPQSPVTALALGRRLPLWDEARGEFSSQVVAIARILSRRGMAQYGLSFDSTGRVVEKRVLHPGASAKHLPTRRFPLTVAGQEVRVEYIPDYFPNRGQALFEFRSPHEPALRHPLSETGYLSQFVARDAVEACGGPEPFATLFAEAQLRGDDQAFVALFEAPRPEPQPKGKAGRKRPVSALSPSPVLGEHTARAVAEQVESTPAAPAARQDTLF
jgi:hypothetical protein